MTVGTTTTAAPGIPASVTNSGTDSAAVLNFVLPAPTQGYADFYGLQPTDNAAPIAPGDSVAFPTAGSADGGIVSSAGGTVFTVTDPGAYLIAFRVPVTAGGQLVLAVNGGDIASTITGRAAGDSDILGLSIETLTAGSTISVRNPASGTSSITVTPSAGGAAPVSAHLVIVKLA